MTGQGIRFVDIGTSLDDLGIAHFWQSSITVFEPVFLFHLLPIFFRIFAIIWQANKSTVNQFGEQIKQLREQKGWLQRQVANQLEMDTPMLSKIERGERNAKREHLAVLSKIFEVPEEDLLSLWLADKVYDVVKDENVALKALGFAEEELKTHKKKKNK